jgi:hypothetical protein
MRMAPGAGARRQLDGAEHDFVHRVRDLDALQDRPLDSWLLRCGIAGQRPSVGLCRGDGGHGPRDCRQTALMLTIPSARLELGGPHASGVRD